MLEPRTLSRKNSELSNSNSKAASPPAPAPQPAHLSDDASPGFRSSSGDEESKKAAAAKRKKLKKKKDRDSRKRESDNDTLNHDDKAAESPVRKDDETAKDRRKSSSPGKSLSGFKHRLQQKDSPERRGGGSEERKPSVPRKTSLYTNYDLTDVLREISKYFIIFSRLTSELTNITTMGIVHSQAAAFIYSSTISIKMKFPPIYHLSSFSINISYDFEIVVCSKKGLIDKSIDMEIIRNHVDNMRIREEKTKKNPVVPDAMSEEDFEEVIGSGLTSETASNRGATPKQKPKTIPGKRTSKPPAPEVTAPNPPGPEVKRVKDKSNKFGHKAKVKTRRKTEKTEAVNLDHEETTQTVVTQIEFQMPRTTEDFERQLANMKHIPTASRPPPSKFKIPATLRQQTSNMVALPPLVASTDKQTRQKLKHQFQAEYDKFADKEFYKEFRFTFIPLPVPTEELPSKCCNLVTRKLPGVDLSQCLCTSACPAPAPPH